MLLRGRPKHMKHPRLHQPVRPRDMHEQKQRLLFTWVFPPDSKPKAWELFPSDFFSPAARAYVVFPKSPWKPLTVHQYRSTWAPAMGESASQVSTGCIQAGMSSVEILLPVVPFLGDTVEGLLHLCLTTAISQIH